MNQTEQGNRKRSRRRFDALAALGLIIVAAGIGAWNAYWRHWNHLDEMPVMWDEAHFEAMSIRLNNAMREGLAETARVYVNYSPDQAPFLPLSTSFLYFLLPAKTETALVANSIYVAVLLLSIYFLAAHLSQRLAGLLACAGLIAIRPMLEFTRLFRTETALTALVTLTVLCLVKSSRFRKPWWALAAGIAGGAALLTNGIAAVYLAGAALYVTLGMIFDRRLRARQILFWFVAAVPAFGMAASWYVPNLQNLWKFLTDFGFGESARRFGAGGTLFTLQNWLYYPRNIIAALLLPLSIAFLVTTAAGIAAAFVNARRNKPSAVTQRTTSRGFDVWLLVVWAASSYFFLSIPLDKKIHFALTFLPAVVLLLTYVFCKANRTIVKICGAVLILFACGMNFRFHFTQTQPYMRESDVRVVESGKELWQLGEIADSVARNSGPRDETAVAFLANHAVFQAKTFELEALHRGYDFTLHYVSIVIDSQISSAIRKSDFVIIKEGRQTPPHLVIAPEKVQKILKALKKETGEEFRKIEEFPLPDGKAILLKRTR